MQGKGPAVEPVANRDPATGFAAYDYLLIAGPGRSGTEFLYANFKGHPGLVFPEIKEGYYYRSPRRLDRLLRRLARRPGKLLVDIANLGYKSDALPAGVARLQRRGWRVLIVLLLREHDARALSMLSFRHSRGELSALLGARRTEEAVVRDRLTRDNLAAIYRLDVDVLTVHFAALTGNPAAALGVLSRLCGIAGFDRVQRQAVNESVRARSRWFSAGGKAVAVTLRSLGFRATLQRVKDSRWTQKLFFAPLADSEAGNGNGNQNRPRLSENHRQLLRQEYAACCSFIEERSERLAAGIYLRRALGPPAGAETGAGPGPPGATRA